MKKLLISITLITLTGCASYGINHMKGHINGAFVYNGVPVIGNVDIDHWGCVGFSCQQANIQEIINDANTRPTANQGV